jgi:aryl-alcohol dehydrogenase-like predicted oxidoreductase
MAPFVDTSETLTIGGELCVRRLGFGTVRLTGPEVWGEPSDPAASRRLLRHVVEAGVNFIDTADSYGPKIVERLIAEALYPYPDDLVIATKGGLAPSGPGRFERDARPERLRVCCEESLRRLRLDRIDLYQLHAVDPEVPVEESVGALADLRDRGLIRCIGMSNVTVGELERAREIVPIVSVQNCYNVVDRECDPVVEECQRSEMAFIPWFPLARGKLAQSGSVLKEIARKKGATEAQIAVSWLLHRSPAMLPIPGTNNLDHFKSNLASREIVLTANDMRELDILDEETPRLVDDPARVNSKRGHVRDAPM